MSSSSSSYRFIETCITSPSRKKQEADEKFEIRINSKSCKEHIADEEEVKKLMYLCSALNLSEEFCYRLFFKEFPKNSLKSELKYTSPLTESQSILLKAFLPYESIWKNFKFIYEYEEIHAPFNKIKKSTRLKKLERLKETKEVKELKELKKIMKLVKSAESEQLEELDELKAQMTHVLAYIRNLLRKSQVLTVVAAKCHASVSLAGTQSGFDETLGKSFDSVYQQLFLNVKVKDSTSAYCVPSFSSPDDVRGFYELNTFNIESVVQEDFFSSFLKSPFKQLGHFFLFLCDVAIQQLQEEDKPQLQQEKIQQEPHEKIKPSLTPVKLDPKTYFFRTKEGMFCSVSPGSRWSSIRSFSSCDSLLKAYLLEDNIEMKPVTAILNRELKKLNQRKPPISLPKEPCEKDYLYILNLIFIQILHTIPRWINRDRASKIVNNKFFLACVKIDEQTLLRNFLWSSEKTLQDFTYKQLMILIKNNPSREEPKKAISSLRPA